MPEKRDPFGIKAREQIAQKVLDFRESVSIEIKDEDIPKIEKLMVLRDELWEIDQSSTNTYEGKHNREELTNATRELQEALGLRCCGNDECVNYNREGRADKIYCSDYCRKRMQNVRYREKDSSLVSQYKYNIKYIESLEIDEKDS